MARISIQPDPFDLAAEYAVLTAHHTDIGGIGCFIGQVRADDGLQSLTLEHYPGMTHTALATLAATAEQRWQLLGCTIIHRIGRLPVGAPIVLVLTAAAHRHAALDATRYLIDHLKTDAPFWKCEQMHDGTKRWVEPAQPADQPANTTVA